jgi:uncharacterized membrane protein YdjX (TVP38/TMEM64 family)
MAETFATGATGADGALRAAGDLVARWPAWAEALGGVWAIAAAPDRLRQWVEGFGLLAPLVFFLAEAAQVVLSPLPGALLPPVGALAFGPWAALALSLGGCAAGAAFVFALARRGGRPLARRLLDPRTLERYTGVLTAQGGLWLCLVFAVPFLPGDAVCALAGLSSVSFRRFLVLSTLGRVPGTALAVALAAGLSAAPGWAVAAAALGAGAVLAVAFGNRRRVEAWVLRGTTAGPAPAVARGLAPPAAAPGEPAGGGAGAVGGVPRRPRMTGPPAAPGWATAEGGDACEAWRR